MFLTHKSTENTGTRYVIFVLAGFAWTNFTGFQIFSIDYFNILSLIFKNYNLLSFSNENNSPQFPLLSLGKQQVAKPKIRFVTSFKMNSLSDKEWEWRVFVELFYLSNVTRFTTSSIV